MAVLVMPDGKAEFQHLIEKDRQDLYIVKRLLAQRVEKIGAVGIIEVGEVWVGHPDKLTPGQRVTDLPGRGEALLVAAATADGRVRIYLTEFSRNEAGDINFGPTNVLGDEEVTVSGFLEPIREVWRARGDGLKGSSA